MSLNLLINKLLFKFSLSVYPPGPPGPQIAINAASPLQMVNQDDVAVIEVEQSWAQDDSIIEQPRIQDDSMVEHPDIRQAQVVSRRDGPIVPYVDFSSDEDSAEEGNLYFLTLPFLKALSFRLIRRGYCHPRGRERRQRGGYEQ